MYHKWGKLHWSKVLWLRLTETNHGECFAVKLKLSYIVHRKIIVKLLILRFALKPQIMLTFTQQNFSHLRCNEYEYIYISWT